MDVGQAQSRRYVGDENMAWAMVLVVGQRNAAKKLFELVTTVVGWKYSDQ